jgi:hypothetical protein
MAERLKAQHWKCCLGVTLTRVRIPLSPLIKLLLAPQILSVPLVVFASGSLTRPIAAQNYGPFSAIAQLPSDDRNFLEGDRVIDFRAYRRQLIQSFWRGFHREGELSFYYGYHFLPDGKFRGQHRTYRGGEAVESFNTKGKWEFDGEILTLIGLRMDNPPTAIVLWLQLGTGTVLTYQSGSKGANYQGMTLKRQADD